MDNGDGVVAQAIKRAEEVLLVPREERTKDQVTILVLAGYSIFSESIISKSVDKTMKAVKFGKEVNYHFGIRPSGNEHGN